MLTAYMEAAMRHAKYEKLDDGGYYGSIEECPGLWWDDFTLEECQVGLREALEDWIQLGLQLNHPFQEIDGIELEQLELAEVDA